MEFELEYFINELQNLFQLCLKKAAPKFASKEWQQNLQKPSSLLFLVINVLGKRLFVSVSLIQALRYFPETTLDIQLRPGWIFTPKRLLLTQVMFFCLYAKYTKAFSLKRAHGNSSVGYCWGRKSLSITITKLPLWRTSNITGL